MLSFGKPMCFLTRTGFGWRGGVCLNTKTYIYKKHRSLVIQIHHSQVDQKRIIQAMANNIKHQLFSGVFYTALAKYSGIIISLVVAGILARLLSPDDFGVVAIATVIIAFFNLFTDMGISPAIVQHKSLTKEELSDIFSFTVWTGIGISILFLPLPG